MRKHDPFSRPDDPYSYFSGTGTEGSVDNSRKPNDQDDQTWTIVNDRPGDPSQLSKDLDNSEEFDLQMLMKDAEGEPISSVLAAEGKSPGLPPDNDWGFNSSSSDNWSGSGVPINIGHAQPVGNSSRWSSLGSGNYNLSAGGSGPASRSHSARWSSPGLDGFTTSLCGSSSSLQSDFFQILSPIFTPDNCHQTAGPLFDCGIEDIAIDNYWMPQTRKEADESATGKEATKRKAGTSPNLSVKSISSETDGDEALSAESNGEETKSEVAVHLNVRKDGDFPQLGMVFQSEEAAFTFYLTHASKVGFKVRKGKVSKRSDGTVRKRDFYCSKQGCRSEKQRNKITKYKRAETRTNCPAMITITAQEQQWEISKVEVLHNHPLGNPGGIGKVTNPCTNLSKIRSVQKNEDEVCPSEVVGVATHVGIAGDSDEKLNSSPDDDYQSLIDHFTQLQLEDPSFFYTFKVDAAKRITNFFWRDGRSKMDYDHFGDLLVLDTTFRETKFGGMICAPFLGLNHHRQYILFGSAFLLDETADSFSWLIKSFVKAMGGRQPKTIITNWVEAMGDAIKLVLPQTQHCLGTWYVYQNAAEHLPEHFLQPGFKRLLKKCMFDCQSEEEFESVWDSILKKYKLCNNSWIETLHSLREKWSSAFLGRTFSGGIQSSHLGTKDIINVFGNTTTETVSISDLVWKCERSAKEMRKQELAEDRLCADRSIPLRSKIEIQAANAYTSTMLTLFQEELQKFLSVTMEETHRNGAVFEYKLVEDDSKEYSATFDESDLSITCSCKMFESIGILCVHALKVFNSRNYMEIPSKYILKRWRKDAKHEVVRSGHGKEGPENQVRLCASEQLKAKALEIIVKNAENKECLKVVETYLAKAEKKIDDLFTVEDVQIGNDSRRKGLKLSCLNQKKKKIHTRKNQAQKNPQSKSSEGSITVQQNKEA